MRPAVTTAKPPAAGSVAAPPTRAVVATRMIGAPLGNLAMGRFIGQSTAEAFIDKFGRAIGADVTQSRHTARVMAATAAEEA
jgi:hypothetical protein